MTDLENRLKQSEEEAAAYMQRMYEAERGEQAAEKDAHQVHRELARRRQESQQELVQARNEIRRGIQQTARLTQRIAELDAELIRLSNLVKTLQMDRDTQQLRQALSASDRAPDVPLSAEPEPDHLERPVPAEAPSSDRWTTTDWMDDLIDTLGQPAAAVLRDTMLLANGSVGTLEGRQRALLSRVRANAERLSLLLGNLTALRDLGTGRLAFKAGPTDISGLIQRALDNVRFRLEERRLRTRLAIGAVPIAQIDPDIVQQILDNLLDKLCRGSQEGSTVGVQAFVEKDPDRSAANPSLLHITLSGTGELECASADASSVDGDLVQALAKLHQGQVWCVSEPDAGTTFHLTLGLEPAAEQPRPTTRTGARA
jgi:signal transduction histidine kinase